MMILPSRRPAGGPGVPFRGSNRIYWAYLVCILLVYVFLQERYRPTDWDDPAYLSFAYNYSHHGIVFDKAYGLDMGTNGVKYFGKTYSAMIASWLDLTGWTKLNSHLFSTFFIVAALLLWTRVLVRLDYTKELATAFFFCAMLAEPFFNAATTSRWDSLALFLVTLSLLLFIDRRYFLSAVAAGIAFETHPIGAVSVVFVLSYLAARPSEARRILERPFRVLAPILIGMIAGAAYYYSLHSDILPQFSQVMLKNNVASERSVQNFIYEYFFRTKYLRHLPELAVVLACLFLHVRNKVYREDPFPLIFFLAMVLFSLIARRPNFKYILYCYPSFLLLALVTFREMQKLRILLLGTLLFWTPQYAYVYYTNRSFDLSAEITAMRNAVPPDGSPVLGGANEWYAFYDRDFYINEYQGDIRKLGMDRFYLVEDVDFMDHEGTARRVIEQDYSGSLLRSFTVNGRPYSVLLEKKKNAGP